MKCDVKKFFDSINHQTLIDILKQKIKDENILNLIQEIIFSFEMNSDKGIPLGNLTSQYFANIYLNELDWFVKHRLRIKYYIRYTDDFLILNSDKNYLLGLIGSINHFLNNRLKLNLHPDKIIVRKHNQGIDFLGYVTLPRYRVLRTKTKKRMFRKVADKNIQSYLGILKHCCGYKLKLNVENHARTSRSGDN